MLSDGLTLKQSEGEAREEVEVLDVAQMLLASVKRAPEVAVEPAETQDQTPPVEPVETQDNSPAAKTTSAAGSTAATTTDSSDEDDTAESEPEIQPVHEAGDDIEPDPDVHELTEANTPTGAQVSDAANAFDTTEPEEASDVADTDQAPDEEVTDADPDKSETDKT